MVRQALWRAILLTCGLPALLSAAQIDAVVDRTRIADGESVRLELRVNGSPDEDVDLTPLATDWDVLNRSQSSQMQIINGSISRSQSQTLTLMPRSSGQLVIPSLCFGPDCSPPVSVTVSDAAATTDSPLLLEVSPSAQTAYVDQQVVLSVRILHRGDLMQASLSEPTIENGTAEVRQLGEDRRFETRRDGTLYQGIERRYLIYPRQAGPLTLSGLQLDGQLESNPSQVRSLFSSSIRQLRRRTEAITIDVLPPQNAQGRLWLPAQQLALTDDWQTDPPTLRVGEPATRTLTLTAEGLPAASLPTLTLPTPDGWKSYPDQPARENRESQTGLIGMLQQKLALVPMQAGPITLPALTLDWFNVTSNQWEQIHLPAVTVEVEAASSEIGSVEPESSVAPPVSPATVAPNRPTKKEAPAPGNRFWFLISIGLALGWALTGLLWWRSSRAPSNVPSNTPQNAEKDAFRSVLNAAKRHDAEATRRALISWIRLRWTPHPGTELDTLTHHGNPALKASLDTLNHALYKNKTTRWQGTTLIAALKNLPAPDTSKTTALPPLYPDLPREKSDH